MSNITKGESYRFAIVRIKVAREAGFYLEAIALCESIITDRIYSVLTGRGLSQKPTHKQTLGAVLSGWKKIARGTEELSLRERVDNWREMRNQALHAACRSEPGQPTIPNAQFVLDARAAAEEGQSLMNAIKKWQGKTKPKKSTSA